MLKIRMQRTGRINSPSFRIIVTEHTRGPKTGNIVEKVGTYNPTTKERILNEERIKYWLSVGAKASGTMHNMLISAGILSGKKVNVLPKKSPPKKEEEKVAADAVATAPVVEEAKPEAPAEEETKSEAPAETSAPVETAEAK